MLKCSDSQCRVAVVHFVTDLFASLASLEFLFYFILMRNIFKVFSEFAKTVFLFLRVLVFWLWLGTEPGPPALEGEVLTTAPPWMSLVFLLSVCFLRAWTVGPTDGKVYKSVSIRMLNTSV